MAMSMKKEKLKLNDIFTTFFAHPNMCPKFRMAVKSERKQKSWAKSKNRGEEWIVAKNGNERLAKKAFYVNF